MARDVPNDVQQFIFEFVDSIEQLDILLLLRAQPERTWTGEQVAKELRTNPQSASGKLSILKAIGLLDENIGSPASYCYQPATPELAAVVDALAEECKIRRHRVYELIFSSLKRARKFLNAFTVVDPKKGGDDHD